MYHFNKMQTHKWKWFPGRNFHQISRLFNETGFLSRQGCQARTWKNFITFVNAFLSRRMECGNVAIVCFSLLTVESNPWNGPKTFSPLRIFHLLLYADQTLTFTKQKCIFIKKIFNFCHFWIFLQTLKEICLVVGIK